jgi:ribonuclease BN (tRNA processing enzyme)
MVLATDTEHYSCSDRKLLELSEGTDLLIYDAMYTPEEYEGSAEAVARTGWGHSTYREGAKLARAAHARKLVLFHHDPDHDDAKVREIETRARREFPDAMAAYEGLVVKLA